MLALWPLLHRVLERVAHDSLAPRAGDDGHGLGHGPRVVADLHEVLDANVQAFEVLAHQHDVHVLEPAARHERTRRPHVGEQLERLAQPDVHRAEPGPHRCRERALQCQAVLADAFDGGVRQRRAGGLHRRHPGELLVPVEREAGGLEHPHRLLGDLRADPVARNQGRVVRHGS